MQSFQGNFRHIIMPQYNRSHTIPPMAYYSFTSETLTLVLGLVLNVLLLCLIKVIPNVSLGTYKYLLSVFAVHDIFLCILHGVLNPVVIVIGNTFGTAIYAPWQSHKISSVFYACFTIPFALMNIHFLYRYWSVARPCRILWFTRPAFVALVIAYPVVQLIVWFFCALGLSADKNDVSLSVIKRRFRETHEFPIQDGWLVMDHWRNGQLNVRVLNLVLIAGNIMFANLLASFALARMTYRAIARMSTASATHASMQYTLLVATAVPILCVYIPYFIINTCPFFSIPVYDFANKFSLFVSIFPAWDALVIIILIRDYRLGILRLFGCKKPQKVAQLSSMQFSSSVLQ